MDPVLGNYKNVIQMNSDRAEWQNFLTELRKQGFKDREDFIVNNTGNPAAYIKADILKKDKVIAAMKKYRVDGIGQDSIIKEKVEGLITKGVKVFVKESKQICIIESETKTEFGFRMTTPEGKSIKRDLHEFVLVTKDLDTSLDPNTMMYESFKGLDLKRKPNTLSKVKKTLDENVNEVLGLRKTIKPIVKENDMDSHYAYYDYEDWEVECHKQFGEGVTFQVQKHTEDNQEVKAMANNKCVGKWDDVEGKGIIYDNEDITEDHFGTREDKISYILDRTETHPAGGFDSGSLMNMSDEELDATYSDIENNNHLSEEEDSVPQTITIDAKASESGELYFVNLAKTLIGLKTDLTGSILTLITEDLSLEDYSSLCELLDSKGIKYHVAEEFNEKLNEAKDSTLPFVPIKDSTMITGAAYDDEMETLYIRFKNSVYEYYDVPEEIYQGLLTTPSVGRYFNQEIRPVFQYTLSKKYMTRGRKPLDENQDYHAAEAYVDYLLGGEWEKLFDAIDMVFPQTDEELDSSVSEARILGIEYYTANPEEIDYSKIGELVEAESSNPQRDELESFIVKNLHTIPSVQLARYGIAGLEGEELEEALMLFPTESIKAIVALAKQNNKIDISMNEEEIENFDEPQEIEQEVEQEEIPEIVDFRNTENGLTFTPDTEEFKALKNLHDDEEAWEVYSDTMTKGGVDVILDDVTGNFKVTWISVEDELESNEQEIEADEELDSDQRIAVAESAMKLVKGIVEKKNCQFISFRGNLLEKKSALSIYELILEKGTSKFKIHYNDNTKVKPWSWNNKEFQHLQEAIDSLYVSFGESLDKSKELKSKEQLLQEATLRSQAYKTDKLTKEEKERRTSRGQDVFDKILSNDLTNRKMNR